MNQVNQVLVQKLINHYEEHAPKGWTTAECISGMVHKWHGDQADSSAYMWTHEHLNISKDQGDLLKHANNPRGRYYEFVNEEQTPRQNQANVLAMLRGLLESGEVVWQQVQLADA